MKGALAALPPEDSVLRIKLLARLAGALRDRRMPERVASLSQEAVAMARRLGDPGTLAFALDGLYAGIRYPQHTNQWRAMGDELVQTAEAAGDTGARLGGPPAPARPADARRAISTASTPSSR